MTIREKVIALYELLYRKTNNYKDYTFVATPKQSAMVDNFIKRLEQYYSHSSITSDILIEYFLYAFAQRHDQKTRFGQGKVMLNWIIGPKALDRWINRDTSKAHYIATNYFITQYAINRYELHQLIDDTTKQRDVTEIINYEENVKSLYHNTPEGQATCIESTTLYNHKSKWCVLCHYKQSCKILLHDNFRNIYVARGYDR